MAESYLNLTEGSGKKAHTFERTIGANSVHDSVVIPGEHYLASYVAYSGNVSNATASAHVLQLMAGSSLQVRVRRIRVEQNTNATTGSVCTFEVYRLSTAGTGGTSVTPAKFDTGDAASGATAMTLPSAKGTEGVVVFGTAIVLRQAVAASGAVVDDVWEWEQHPGTKPLIIPAGTSNGIAIKTSGVAGSTVLAMIEFTESNF